MGRPKITVTNVGKDGKIADGKWHVRIHNKWRTFTEAEWKNGGIQWMNSQLGARGE